MPGPKEKRDRTDERDGTGQGGGQDVERDLTERHPDDIDVERGREETERRPHREEP